MLDSQRPRTKQEHQIGRDERNPSHGKRSTPTECISHQLSDKRTEHSSGIDGQIEDAERLIATPVARCI